MQVEMGEGKWEMGDDGPLGERTLPEWERGDERWPVSRSLCK